MLHEFRSMLWPLAAGILLAFFGGFLLFPNMIPALRKLKYGQQVRDDGPASHLVKQGTPTMGGIGFFAVIPIATGLVVWFLGGRSWVLAGAALVYGLLNGVLGYLDDYAKVAKKRSLGLTAKQKLAGQILLSGGLAWFCYAHTGDALLLPWGGVWTLGVWLIPLTTFLGVGFTNAVNLIDGLDGLCGTVTAVVMAAMALIVGALSSVQTDAAVAQQMMGLAVLCGAVAGCCLAFLRVNAYPAQVFMGDTGAMLLGGLVVAIFCLSGLTLLLPIMGGMYLATALSVMIQVGYFKVAKGKRFFRMAPLHHHFEKGGMSESRIVAMYTGITVALCLAVVIWVAV